MVWANSGLIILIDLIWNLTDFHFIICASEIARVFFLLKINLLIFQYFSHKVFILKTNLVCQIFQILPLKPLYLLDL